MQISRVAPSLVHRRRNYQVFIDARLVGTLTRAEWLGNFVVSPGRHLVQLRSGRLTSQVVAVVVREGQTAGLTCAARPPLESLARQITNPARSIVLRDDAWDSSSIPHRLPYGWCITRYDPARRDSNGAYTGNGWTSISDIGGFFEDGELTRQIYESTEQAYLTAVESFAAAVGITHLQVRDPDDGGRGRRGRPDHSLVHGQVLSLSEAVEVVRAMLRETTWCRLEALTDDFTVHVGSDLYLYVGSTDPCASAVETVEAGGLFVKPLHPHDGSPYIPNDGWLRPYPRPAASTD